MKYSYAFISNEQQLPSMCVGRIILPIFTADKKDSEKESHVESTTTNTAGRKRRSTAGNRPLSIIT